MRQPILPGQSQFAAQGGPADACASGSRDRPVLELLAGPFRVPCPCDQSEVVRLDEATGLVVVPEDQRPDLFLEVITVLPGTAGLRALRNRAGSTRHGRSVRSRLGSQSGWFPAGPRLPMT
ncbi:hypothetical protein ABIB35_001016 [Arthrobacter sp. UYP6]|uniref:hypothetical protein n=1 Tax=Arthrobacter sp. UYP6 TaxID=1756378 RepID=UPI003396D248